MRKPYMKFIVLASIKSNTFIMTALEILAEIKFDPAKSHIKLNRDMQMDVEVK